ncbi:MAG: peptidyl-prolyl cis-trans isomerase, partial [Rhodovibrionaceae bacterium]
LFDSEEEARSFFEKLVGGASFDTALQDFSGESPIDLGEVSRTELSVLLPEATDKAFSLDAGEVSEPFRSSLGWHVLHVREVTPGSTPEYSEVKDQLREDMTMRLAIDDMIGLANEVDDALAGGASLEETATQFDLPLETYDSISREGKNRQGETVEGLPSPERFLDVAFTTEVGEDSLLTETESGGYFVLRVDGETPSQLRPLAEVRAEVERLWLQSQRRQKAREVAEGYAEELRNGASLEEIAEQAGTQLQRSQPLTRDQQGPSVELVSQMFSAQPGDSFVAGGQTAQFVGRLEEIVSADPGADPDGREDVAQRLNQGLSGDLLALYSNDLQRRYGVEIDEEAVQSVLTGF